MAIGPRTSQARSLHSDRAHTRLGRYVATEHAHDRAQAKLGRYVATELSQNVDTTRIDALLSTL